MNRFFINAALVSVVLTAAPSAALAAEHPAYLHALADLRDARAHLERRPGDERMKWDEQKAIREIDEAIREIKEAAVWDGKDIHDHVRMDAHLEFGGRLRYAKELLEKARRDCLEDRDHGFAHGMQERAVSHIGEAIRHIDEARF